MSGSNQFALLRTRRFAPFFWTQALGAFNDNVFRNATVVLIAGMGLAETDLAFYSNIAPALFILPFFLFSASAGQLAEKYEKTRIIRFVKLFEIVAMAVAAYGFYAHSVALLLFVLFLMGLHSTLFGPIKYAILPQALEPQELVGGNGMVEMGTSLAILLGMVLAGSLMAISGSGPMLAAIAVIAIAVLGYFISRAVPLAPPTAPDLQFSWNIFGATANAMRFIRKDRAVFNSVLGISWFWFFGGVFTANLPLYALKYLGGNENVITLVLTFFSVGVGIGSLLCERLSGHKVEIGLVPLGSIGLTLFGVDLYFAQPHVATTLGLTPWTFITAPGHWRIAMDFILIGLFAGFYIVPLFALVQSRAAKSELSRVIAGNNILNAVFIVASAVFGIGLQKLGFSLPQLFLITAIMNAAVAIYIYTLVPEFFMRFLSYLIVRTLYRVDSQGLDKIPETGAALIVCNHVSFVDPLIVMGEVRRPMRFVMYYKIHNIPLLKFIFQQARTIPIAGAKEDPALMAKAFDEIDAALAAGELVGIFPEGGITLDGSIQPFRPGMEKALARRPVPVIPLALRGLWGSVFSRRDSMLGRARLPRRFRAHIGLAVGDPIPPEQVTAAVAETKVRELRGDDA
jgi:1-acyl-sn-glycerol-3-phosphate acyltransferase